MLHRLFQRAAGKNAGSREATPTSRPLPVAIPVPPSPPREPASPPAPVEAASSQRFPATPAPIAATGEVAWQSLPGGQVVGSGRMSVAPQVGKPFAGWESWEGFGPDELPEPEQSEDSEAPGLPDWVEEYRELDAREQELTCQIEELAVNAGPSLPAKDRVRLEQLCQERAEVLLRKIEADPLQTVLPGRLDESDSSDWFFREATAAPPRRTPEPTPAPKLEMPPPALPPQSEPLMQFGFGVGPLEEGFTDPQVRSTPPAPVVRNAARPPVPAMATPRPAKSFRRRVG